MGIGFKLVFDSFRLDNPLISVVLVFVNKLSGFVVVHGMNLSLSVLDVGALNLETLDEHLRYKECRKWKGFGKEASKGRKEEKKGFLGAASRSSSTCIYRGINPT